MSKFKDYVTSSAFNLSLSANQIDTLLAFDGVTDYEYLCAYGWAMTSIDVLKRKGLLVHNKNNYSVTDEGALIVKLLKMAGFKHRNKTLKLCKTA